MLVLAIDTSTPQLITGLVRTDDMAVLAQRSVVGGRQHNEFLVPYTTEVLAEASATWDDLAAVCVGCGPGPFTGLRVGMATGAAFADALGIPAYGVPSHNAIAAEFYARGGSGKVLVVTDARRREVYYSSYADGRLAQGPDVVSPAELSLSHEVEAVIGDEGIVDKLPEVYARGFSPLLPTVSGLVSACDMNCDPAPLRPLYLRRPDAAEPKNTGISPAVPRVSL